MEISRQDISQSSETALLALDLQKKMRRKLTHKLELHHEPSFSKCKEVLSLLLSINYSFNMEASLCSKNATDPDRKKPH